MSCRECDRARGGMSAMFRMGCIGCETRAVAMSDECRRAAASGCSAELRAMARRVIRGELTDWQKLGGVWYWYGLLRGK